MCFKEFDDFEFLYHILRKKGNMKKIKRETKLNEGDLSSSESAGVGYRNRKPFPGVARLTGDDAAAKHVHVTDDGNAHQVRQLPPTGAPFQAVAVRALRVRQVGSQDAAREAGGVVLGLVVPRAGGDGVDAASIRNLRAPAARGRRHLAGNAGDVVVQRRGVACVPSLAAGVALGGWRRRERAANWVARAQVRQHPRAQQPQRGDGLEGGEESMTGLQYSLSQKPVLLSSLFLLLFVFISDILTLV